MGLRPSGYRTDRTHRAQAPGAIGPKQTEKIRDRPATHAGRSVGTMTVMFNTFLEGDPS